VVAFYNERRYITVDGVTRALPQTHFSRSGLLPADDPHQVGLHGLQLRAKVAPAVSAVGGNDEYCVVTARRNVFLLKLLVGRQGDGLQELALYWAPKFAPSSSSEVTPLPQ
jgi:hypothetical protein